MGQACSGAGGESDPDSIFKKGEINPGSVYKDYIVHMKKKLGEGAYGTVYVGEPKDLNRAKKQGVVGNEVAVKSIKKNGMTLDDKKMLRTEVLAMRKVKHPNVVTLLDVYDTSKVAYLVLEKLSGGELFDVIVDRQHFSEADASKTVRQFVEGLASIHKAGIVHRDLKPENLLFTNTDNTVLKIADFGLAEIGRSPDEMFEGAAGTPNYVAPEVLKMRRYDTKVDMWAVGVITFIILCGYPPFYDDDQYKMYEQIKSGKFEMKGSVWRSVSDKAKDFVKKTIVVDPKQRMSAKEALNHPWIKDAAGLPTDALPDERRAELRAYIAKRRWKKAIFATRLSAALSIQAGFRGMKVREEVGFKPTTVAKPTTKKTKAPKRKSTAKK